MKEKQLFQKEYKVKNPSEVIEAALTSCLEAAEVNDRIAWTHKMSKPMTALGIVTFLATCPAHLMEEMRKEVLAAANRVMTTHGQTNYRNTDN